MIKNNDLNINDVFEGLLRVEDIKIISEEELLKELSEPQKRLYGRLSKREKEEMRFKHSLSPDMDFDTKFDLCEEFSYRPDEDTIDALDFYRFDSKERRVAFMEAFRMEVAKDTEPPHKVAEYVWRALQTNNAEQLLYALCGFSANNLAKRAGIVPDDSNEFSGDEMKTARLVVKWSNGKETACRCDVREEDFKICNFRRKIFQKYADNAEIYGVFVKVRPYSSRKSRMFSCIDEEERKTYNDMLSYWYSMTPSAEDDDNDPDDEFEVFSRYYAYDNNGDVVGEDFICKEVAIAWAKKNNCPIVKAHKYFTDENGKAYPDGDPEVVWEA